MNQEKFVNDQSVIMFRNWLINRVDAGFAHKYCIIPSGKKPVSETWACTSVHNAFEQYFWPFSYTNLINSRKETASGTSFSDSANALNEIREHLSTSINRSDETGVFNSCKMVLDWGGVLTRGRKGKTNLDKLNKIREKFGLVNYLVQAKNLLSLGSADTSGSFKVFDLQGRSSVLQMNSGFTKIYSILIDNFVIYDGRVGAGIGLMVSQFKNQNPLANIDSLMFAFGNAAESKKCLNNKIRRNPSSGNIVFSNLFQGENQESKCIKHIQNNLKASWLIDTVLNHLPEKSSFLAEAEPARALEAALFMIGNCVCVQCERNQILIS